VRTSFALFLPLVVACSSGGTDQSDSGPPKDGAASNDTATMDVEAAAPPMTDGGPFHGGNPNGSCSTGVPAGGMPVDTSTPTTVVGSGTPASCTFTALNAAVTKGGIITFDCGTAPTTIAVTATMNMPVSTNSVIDGGGLVTLDGQGKVGILSFQSPGYRTNVTQVTIQHLAFINAKTNPVDAIPYAKPPCSQGWDDGEGGAINMRDGNLTVIDSIFTNDKAAPLGPDTGGGAIYINGSLHGALIVDCTFTNNAASNAGAVGALNAELDVYNSLVTGNVATGNGANNNDPTMCSAMNNGQNEIGSGGNGGALYGDGDGFGIIVCGDDIENNAAGTNAFGGGIFFTSDDFSGTLSIVDSTIENNTGGHWTEVKSGTITNAGTAVGTNAKSITITNSMVQGYP
jgi:hypothetical protein